MNIGGDEYGAEGVPIEKEEYWARQQNKKKKIKEIKGNHKFHTSK